MTHSPMSQNRVRDALEPQASELLEALRRALKLPGARKIDLPLCPSEAEYIRDLIEADHAALTAPPASDAAGAEGERRERVAALVRSAMFAENDMQSMSFSERTRERVKISEEVVDQILAAAPTAPAQAPSRPVDAGGVEAVFGTDEPDLASDIACAVMCLPWARGGDADEHGDRYGQIQEIADPLIRAALATQPAGTEASRPVGGEIWGVEDTGDAIWIGPMRPDGCKIDRTVYFKDDLGLHRPEYVAQVKADARLICDSVNRTPPQAYSTGQGDGQARIEAAIDAGLKACDLYAAGNEDIITRDDLRKFMAAALTPSAPIAAPVRDDVQSQEGGKNV